VVIITVDTLRADHLGAYDEASSTPRIDAFAADATVFEHSTAPMPLTRPSHFSMLTSLYPREHGVLNNAMRLPDSALSLTEILGDNGYRTGGFVGVRLLGPDSGADQGFDYYDQPAGARVRDAEEVVRSALGWLDGLDRNERCFLWVHLFDPHLPYTPPAEFRGDVPVDRPEINWKRLTEIARENDGNVPASILEEAKQLYRGEVAYVDHWVGELLGGLAERRSSDDTLIVFTADHGECFENGVYFEHADCLWEPGIRIPMIARYPRTFRPGERVSTQTSIVDVAPTVLRAAGIEVPQGWSGRALQDAAGFADRRVLVQYPFYQPSAADRRPQRLEVVRTVAGEPVAPILVGTEKVGIVDTAWKLLRTGDRQELYALAPVADERTDRAETDPGVADRMGDILKRQLAEHPLTVIDSPEINEELLETLRALGYL
jgi:arylsulfatase A-like enzyme